MDGGDTAGEDSLVRRIEIARSQVAKHEQELALAEEDEEARKKFDAEHGAQGGTIPEGVPCGSKPEPEPQDGENILDIIDEEY